MSDAERARRARRKKKWKQLLAARDEGEAIDEAALGELIEEFGDTAVDEVTIDGPHPASIAAAQKHLSDGGTEALKACGEGCYELWRDHRRPIEQEAARRYRDRHIMVPRPTQPD